MINSTWGVVVALAAVLLIVAAISIVGAVIAHHLKRNANYLQRIDNGQAAATGAAMSAAERAGEAATAAAKAVDEVATAAAIVASELKRGGEAQSTAMAEIHRLVDGSHTEMKEYIEQLTAQLVRLGAIPEPPDKAKASPNP